jgi:hypothetical protein
MMQWCYTKNRTPLPQERLSFTIIARLGQALMDIHVEQQRASAFIYPKGMWIRKEGK